MINRHVMKQLMADRINRMVYRWFCFWMWGEYEVTNFSKN